MVDIPKKIKLIESLKCPLVNSRLRKEIIKMIRFIIEKKDKEEDRKSQKKKSIIKKILMIRTRAIKS